MANRYRINCIERPDLGACYEGGLEAAHSIAWSIAMLAYRKIEGDAGKSDPVMTEIVSESSQEVIAKIVYKGRPWTDPQAP